MKKGINQNLGKWFEKDDKTDKKGIDLQFDDKEFENIDGNETTDKNNNLKETKQIRLTINDKRLIEMNRKEELNKVFDRLPNKDEYFHIVSNGNFDYFKIIPRILQLEPGTFELFASTWTMNYNNIDELTKLIETGRINSCNMLVGDYLRRREPLVFETLKQSMFNNSGKLKEFSNHCKIVLMSNGLNYYTVEMSANFTANRRTEQIVMTNCERVYNFHKTWMQEVLIEKEN